MLKTLTRLLLLYFLNGAMDVYSMEYKAKSDTFLRPSPFFLKYLHTELMEAIRSRNIPELSQTLYRLKNTVPPESRWLVLDVFDKETHYSPLTLAKSLPKDEIRIKIIHLLKSENTDHLHSKKDSMAHLKAIDTRFNLMQKSLLNSISTGSLAHVTSLLKDLYEHTVCITSTERGTVINNFQFLLLLNQSNPEFNHTPLSLAQEKGFTEIALLLKQHGAIVQNSDKKKITSLRLTPPETDSFFKMLNGT